MRKRGTVTFQPEDDVALLLNSVRKMGRSAQTRFINEALKRFGAQALKEVTRQEALEREVERLRLGLR